MSTRFNEGVVVGHDDGIDLLSRHRLLIPARVETPRIDFPGYLLRAHTVAGIGKEIDNGLFKFHLYKRF